MYVRVSQNITDANMKDFAVLIASGALPSLTHLFLDSNQIGDADITAVCSTRRIKLNTWA